MLRFLSDNRLSSQSFVLPLLLGVLASLSSGCGNLFAATDATTSHASVTSHDLSLAESANHSAVAFPPNTFEADGQQVISWLKAKEFDKVEALLAEAIRTQRQTRGGWFYADSVLDQVFKRSKSKKLDQSLLLPLNEWIAQSPESSLAHVARANFYYAQAWEARGARFSGLTSKSKKEKYQQLLLLSIQDGQKALELDQENPLGLLHWLTLGRNAGMNREEYETTFDTTIALVPNFTQAYYEKSQYLDRRWRGENLEERLDFTRQIAADAPKGSVLPLLLAWTHEAYCTYYPNKREYLNRPEVWADIESSYTRVLNEFPEAGLYALQFAEMAEKAGRESAAKKYFQLAMEREPNHPRVLKNMSKFGY